jgi:hypothetical protein
MTRILSLLAAGFVLVNAATAQQRPLITEDVDIIPTGSVRVSAGVDFLQNAKFPLSGLTGDLTRVGDLNIDVGLSPNVQLEVGGTVRNFLAVNSARNPSPIPLSFGGSSTSDTGDFSLATKIKIRNESRNLPAVGFKFGFMIPSSNQARGIGTNQINIFGDVLLQKKFGVANNKDPKANVFGNIGLGILNAPLANFTQNDVFRYGLAGIFRVNSNVNIATEINGRLNTRSGAAPLGTESQSQFRVGTQVKASGLRFDTAAAFGLSKYSPRSGITFGITFQSPSVFTPTK